MKKLGGGGGGFLFSNILVQTAEDVLQRRHEKWIKTGIIVSQRKSPDIFILSTIRHFEFMETTRRLLTPPTAPPPPPPRCPPLPPSPSQELLHLFRTQPTSNRLLPYCLSLTRPNSIHHPLSGGRLQSRTIDHLAGHRSYTSLTAALPSKRFVHALLCLMKSRK